MANELAARGRRVLVLANGQRPFSGPALPPDLRLVAAVELREQLRPDARATLEYFAAQDVTVRVVSGDSAPTVGAVAVAVGLAGGEDPVDARSWPKDEARRDEVIRTHTLFGRVTPEQKRALIGSLRRQGHVIAAQRHRGRIQGRRGRGASHRVAGRACPPGPAPASMEGGPDRDDGGPVCGRVPAPGGQYAFRPPGLAAGRRPCPGRGVWSRGFCGNSGDLVLRRAERGPRRPSGPAAKPCTFDEDLNRTPGATKVMGTLRKHDERGRHELDRRADLQ
jgi:hypothetical protein